MPRTHHAHALDLQVTGRTKLSRRDDRTTKAIGGLTALVLLALLADIEGPRARLVINPSQWDFGAQPVGTNVNQAVTLHNLSSVPFNLAALTLSNAGAFAVDSSTCPDGQVPAQGECTISVMFHPMTTGAFAGTLRQGSAGPSLDLRGTGQAVAAAATPPAPIPVPVEQVPAAAAPQPEPVVSPPAPTPPAPQPTPVIPAAAATPPKPVTVPPPLITAARFSADAFDASADVDSEATLAVALRNTGQTTIGAVTLEVGGSHATDFAIETTTCTLGPPKDECAIAVRFRPHEAGAHEATLVAERGGVRLASTLLRGTGRELSRPVATISPERLQFSRSGEEHTVVVQNNGTAPLTLSGFKMENSGSFELRKTGCTDNTSVMPQKACAFQVRFTGRGSAQGRLAVLHNGATATPPIELSALLPGAMVRVPRVIGAERDRAVRMLAERQLSAEPIGEVVRCADIGRVVTQDPLADGPVPAGSRVALTVASVGLDPAVVPDVRRQPRALAEQRIREARLSVSTSVRTEESTTAAPGSVIRTDPMPRTRLAPNCPVTLTVAAAPPPVTVPNYVGQPLAQAKQSLGSGGVAGAILGAFAPFRLGSVTTADGSTIAKGDEANWIVSAQSPPGNEVMPRQMGTEINLTVERNRPVLTRPAPQRRTPRSAPVIK